MADRSREESKEYVLKTVKEHDVKFIKLWFTDILGMLKSLAISGLVQTRVFQNRA